MDKKIEVGVHNYFDIVIRDAKTLSVIKENIRGYNTILNNFWASYLLINNKNALGYMNYGSGSVEPLPTDSGLTAYIGYKTVTDIIKDYSEFLTNGIIKRTSKIRLEASEENGKTIREVGLARAGGGNNYTVTKSLLKDSNGNPIEIIKDNTMVVDIYSTFYVVIPMKYITGDDPIKINNKKTTSFLSWLLCDQLISNQSWYAWGCKILAEDLINPRWTIPGWDYCTKTIATIGGSANVETKAFTFYAPEVPSVSVANEVLGICAYEITPGLFVNTPNQNINKTTIIKEVLGTGDGTNKDFKSKYGNLINDGLAKVFVNDVEVPSILNYDYPSRSISGGLDGVRYTGQKTPTGNYPIFENKFWDKIPMTQFNFTNYQAVELWVCDTIDGTFVKALSSSSGIKSIPIQYQQSRYFYTANLTSGAGAGPIYEYKDVHLETPPPAGATVALTYTPNCLPKDTSNVIRNLSVTISFAEYIPE